MNIATYHRCRLPLTSPLTLRTAENTVTFDRRETVLIVDEHGHWAEAAPLSGFSRESADEVVAAIKNPAADDVYCPSLQFATNCLRAIRHESPRWPAAAQIAINALLTGSAADFTPTAHRLADSKCRSVKLKVGGLPLDEDIDRVRQLRNTLRADQTIRLDANRGWDFATAVTFGQSMLSLGCDAIEYLEEPINEPSRLEEFHSQTRLPYALDETLLEDVAIEDFPSVAALIIKPTLIGSLKRIESLAQIGKPLVFSGCFESGVGTLHIARLAAMFSPSIPHGLDTYSRIANDVLAARLEMDDWTLNMTGPPRVDIKTVAEFSG